MDSKSVREFIVKEVPDWDDEVVATARFKAFSGQRSDWEPKYLFWRDLIIKIARHFGFLLIRPSEVKSDWFNRGGLTPLCIDHVLFVMYSEGDIILCADLVDPTSGRLSQLFKKVRNLMLGSIRTTEVISEDQIILTAALKDKAVEVVKLLSDSHWNSSCVVTMWKLQDICGGPDEASAVLSYLSSSGKAQHFSVSKKDFVEGVKISFSTTAVSSVSNLDHDVLYLIWTTEKLQQQLDVIDRRYEMSRKSALTFLHSGNRKVALRYAREMKVGAENREKCSSLLNKVEEVLGIIANAESTKQVSEAIQIGSQAIKENMISLEEVDLCLSDLQESIDSQKQVEKALEKTPYADIEDDNVEEEFKKLELEVGNENAPVPIPKTGSTSEERESEASEATLISEALSNLKLSDNSSRKLTIHNQVVSVEDKERETIELEAALG
ncbi:Charged multivesicular body protein 7 [Quillaja saponaria]|uniref:Charged multivesicular body protein 7 n=1 Tax=Quillaja saponaria TaxID=32244 RepID=A0AAD7QAE5_QUISA|nr:Charged multivesicular body protein 7 [Quillaja saponaria]